VRLGAGRLHGAKRLVPSGAHADLLVVGTAGGGLAVVEAARGGLRATPCADLDRTRRSADLALDGAAGEALPRGAQAAPRVRDAGLALLAADAFGAAFALVRASAAYAATRQQFGRPLAEFQAVKHQLAEMALEVDPLRGLVWYAAHAFDALPERAPRAAALAKAHVTERASAVARRAVEMHGGLGFTWECDVQIFYKRIVFDRLFLGTPELHRERAAALAGWGAGPEPGAA